jgi:hypothetical protein
VVEVVVGRGGGAGGGVDTRFSAGTCQVVDVVDGNVADVVRLAGVAAFVVGGAAGTFDLTVVGLLGATGVAAVVDGSGRGVASGPVAAVEAAGTGLSDARVR